MQIEKKLLPIVEKRRGRGFKVIPSSEQLEKKARQARIENQQRNPKMYPTNQDIYQLLLDIYSEIKEGRN